MAVAGRRSMMRCFVSWTPPAAIGYVPRYSIRTRGQYPATASGMPIRARGVPLGLRQSQLLTQQDQELVQTAGGEKGGHAADIVAGSPC